MPWRAVYGRIDDGRRRFTPREREMLAEYVDEADRRCAEVDPVRVRKAERLNVGVVRAWP